MPIDFEGIKQGLAKRLGNLEVVDATQDVANKIREKLGTTISVTKSPRETEDEFKRKALTATIFGEEDPENFNVVGSVISNRIKQTGKDVLDVLGTGFDAVGGEQFSKVFQEELDEPSKKKLREAEKVADEILSDKFQPTTQANFFRREDGKFISEFREGNILTATPEELKKFEPFRTKGEKTETKITENIISGTINKLRALDIKEVDQYLDELPVLGDIRKFIKKLRPKSEEEAIKLGLINLGSEDNPVYFDFTGAIGGLKSVGKEGAKEITKKAITKLRGTNELPGNLQRLNLSPTIKKHIVETINQVKPELEALKGGILKNEEVVEAARASEVLRRIVSKEATLKSEAAILRTRQHLAELAKSEKVTSEFIDTLRIVSSEATKRGRELQALGIKADPTLGSIKSKIVKQLLSIGKSTEDILKAAEGVNFTDSQQVTNFYRKFIKPTIPEIIDEYRYINLLSSPKTHIVNAFSNILQITLLRPATRLSSGIIDTIASKLSGKQQEYYVSQVPAYYKGAFNSFGNALQGFSKAIQGKTLIERPDISRIPTGVKILRPFQAIPRILEASDIFFRTLATAGEIEALTSKGLKEVDAVRRATETASELVFRKALDPKNKMGQGLVLSKMDQLTSAVYKLRSVPLIKWFVPFVQTPMNILKQGIEYSPLGISTLPQATNKIEQLGKMMIGSTVFAGAGWLALKDKTTWATPTGRKEKEAFYAAGMQPYSVKIGDKWVSYSRLGPLAYPMAMAAAIKYYTEQNPNSVTDTDLQKTSKILSGIAKFFSDQSYMEGLGDFVGIAQGDTTAVVQAISNLPSQLIPLSSLQRWVANLVDPIYRKTDTKLSIEAIIKNLEKGIPFLSKNLESYKTPFGVPSRRQYPFISAISPLGITKEQEFFKGRFELIEQKKRLDKIKTDLKERLKQRIAPSL